MKNKLVQMTEGNLWVNILRFSFPLIVSNVLQIVFNMSDIAVVGRFSSAESLGAVGSTAILVTMYTGFLIGIGGGINALVAHLYGARREEDIRQSVHTAFLLSLIAGLAVFLIAEVLTRPVLLWLGTKPVFMDKAMLYLRIYFCGIPALALYNCGNAVWSAVGNTRKPMFYLLAAGVLNVALNLLFVIAFRWDVAGVAIASIVAQYVSALLIVVSLFRAQTSFGLCRREMRWSRDKARRILSLAIPAGCQNMIFALANLFIQSAVNSFDAVTVEGISAAANADGLVYDIMAAFYVACASFMAQNTGAGNRERVIRSFRVSLMFSFLAGVIPGGLLILFGRPFLSLFTTDAAVADVGLTRLIIMGIAYGISSLMDCSIAASRGIGKTTVPTVIVIIGSCVYTVFPLYHTVTALYMLYYFSWILTGIAEYLYFRHAFRRRFQK